MKGIKHECQLMERCDGHDHRGVWKGETVVSKCDSPQRGVKSIDKCVI